MHGVLIRISPGYPPVKGRLHTCYSPVRRSPPTYCYIVLPLDLHVLSLPLAFILSQDQTLHCKNFVFCLLQNQPCVSFKILTSYPDETFHISPGMLLQSFQRTSPFPPLIPNSAPRLPKYIRTLTGGASWLFQFILRTLFAFGTTKIIVLRFPAKKMKEFFPQFYQAP